MRISDISVVIPTKERPDDLRRCVESLIAQKDVMPKEVLIVDCGEPEKRLDLFGFKSVPFPVRRIDAPVGLTKQRNIGIRSAAGTIVAFLDDDCAVTENYIAAMESAYGALPDAGGISGIILTWPKTGFAQKLFWKFFFLTENAGSGKLRISGAPSFLDQEVCKRLGKPVKVEVLPGVCSYRRTVFEHGLLFDEGLGGYAWGEDYEFSYRVSRLFNLYVVPDVETYHFHTKTTRINFEGFYYQWATNGYIFWKRFKSKAGLKARAAFGVLIIGLFIKAIKDCFSSRSISAVRGCIKGTLQIISLSKKEKAPLR